MKRQQDDLEAVRAAIENGGAMTIYKTLLSISSDPTTPAQARVGACATIVRMSGLFEDAKRRPALDDDPAEMSAAELRRSFPLVQAELAHIEARLAEGKALLDAAIVGDEDDTDVFA